MSAPLAPIVCRACHRPFTASPCGTQHAKIRRQINQQFQERETHRVYFVELRRRRAANKNARIARRVNR